MTSMPCRCYAIVNDGGWRESLWRAVFGKPEAPISGPVPKSAELLGERARVLFLDKARVTRDQLARLAAGIAVHFQLDPNRTLRELEIGEVPVRLDDNVTVVACPLHTQLAAGRNRAEHLAWAMQRALELLELGQPDGAVMSMVIHLRKHPDLEDHPGLELKARLYLGGRLRTVRHIRDWIEGFN